MQNKNPIWKRPWKYREGILISLTLLILGFALEYASGGSGVAHLVEYPYNFYIGGGLIVVIIFLSAFGKNWALVEWLESIPAAICSVGLLLVVTLFMGFTLQYDDSASNLIRKLGISHIGQSWVYLFANLFLLLSLGMTTAKNLKNFKWKKVGFFVSHLGLWIVVFGANFGSSQLERLQMEISEGSINNIAINPITKEKQKMPFAIKLYDFILDEYNPKLVIVDNNSGKLLHGDGKNVFLIDSAATANLFDWQITVVEYIYTSAKAGNKYYFNNEVGSAPSVLVNAVNKNGDEVNGWVSCGSFNRQYESLKLSDDYSLVMLFPEPKEFTSNIEVFQKNKKPKKLNLQVNKPFTVEGWKVYQLSYDSDLGRWSDVSVIELIRDPWLPVVYVGIFLMLAGAAFMFWVGSKKQNLHSPDKSEKGN